MLEGSLQVGVYLGAFFLAGVLAYLFAEFLPVSRSHLLAAAAALALSMLLGGAVFVAPLATAYLVASIGLIRLPWSNFVARADLSYGIYLTHSVVLLVLAHLFDFEFGLVLFAACLPITATVALLTWTFVEGPSLRHKSAPAQLFRSIVRRIPVAREIPLLAGNPKP